MEQLLAPEENLESSRPPLDATEPGVEVRDTSLVPEAERVAIPLGECRELRLGDRRSVLDPERSPASLGDLAGRLSAGKLQCCVEDDALLQDDPASKERLRAPSIDNDGLVR